MPNQYKNKVVYGDQTLMDITDTTATNDSVLEGQVFYAANGMRSVGALGDATQSSHGLMSAADKIKLDSSQGIYYGECTTAAATRAKEVSIAGITSLTEGLSIRVHFENAQTYNGSPTLDVNGLGAKIIRRSSATNAARYEWVANEILDLVYDGTYWVLINGEFATTSYYGVTKLATSATSTSTTTALTPRSLNSLVQNIIADYPVYSTSATYEVGDRVRYNFNIWECKTAITTAEAWTAVHWTELQPLQTQIDALAPDPYATTEEIDDLFDQELLTAEEASF